MNRPEALRLADAIDPLTRSGLDNLTCAAAAAELRRLEDEQYRLRVQRDALLGALKFVIRGVPDTWEGVQKARAAIAAVEGEKK